MRQRGVGLIELVIVIVVLAGGVALLGTAFVTAARSVATNSDIQIAWQLTQACADHILGSVRQPGAFTSITAPVPPAADPCATFVLDGTSPAVTIAAMTAGTEPCAGAAWSCRLVTVTTTRSGYAASTSFMYVSQ